MASLKATTVMPTIRDVACLEKWASTDLGKTHVIIVEDNAGKTVKVPRGIDYTHYCHGDIDQELGRKAWIIPRKTDCVRSYGFLKAWRERPKMVLTLDDDCFPRQKDFVKKHWGKLDQKVNNAQWVNSLESELYVRGFPYAERKKSPVVLNMGAWTQNPDFDARGDLSYPKDSRLFRARDTVVPKGMYYCNCIMNVAFKPKIVPAFYQLLMGMKTYKVDRFGDIWSGVLVKKIADHLGDAVSIGEPLVRHARASNPYVNMRKEKQGIEWHEQFWKDVDAIDLNGSGYADCYAEIARKLPARNVYFGKLKKAMGIWAGLF